MPVSIYVSRVGLTNLKTTQTSTQTQVGPGIYRVECRYPPTYPRPRKLLTAHGWQERYAGSYRAAPHVDHGASHASAWLWKVCVVLRFAVECGSFVHTFQPTTLVVGARRHLRPCARTMFRGVFNRLNGCTGTRLAAAAGAAAFTVSALAFNNSAACKTITLDDATASSLAKSISAAMQADDLSSVPTDDIIAELQSRIPAMVQDTVRRSVLVLIRARPAGPASFQTTRVQHGDISSARRLSCLRPR